MCRLSTVESLNWQRENNQKRAAWLHLSSSARGFSIYEDGASAGDASEGRWTQQVLLWFQCNIRMHQYDNLKRHRSSTVSVMVCVSVRLTVNQDIDCPVSFFMICLFQWSWRVSPPFTAMLNVCKWGRTAAPHLQAHISEPDQACCGTLCLLSTTWKGFLKSRGGYFQKDKPTGFIYALTEIILTSFWHW